MQRWSRRLHVPRSLRLALAALACGALLQVTAAWLLASEPATPSMGSANTIDSGAIYRGPYSLEWSTFGSSGSLHSFGRSVVTTRLFLSGGDGVNGGSEDWDDAEALKLTGWREAGSLQDALKSFGAPLYQEVVGRKASAFGWPLRSMYCAYSVRSGGLQPAGSISDVLVVDHGWLSAGDKARGAAFVEAVWHDLTIYPTGVIWFGFLVNSCLYSIFPVVGYVIWRSAVARRRYRRSRLGLCASCGYPRDSASDRARCSECGALCSETKAPENPKVKRESG